MIFSAARPVTAGRATGTPKACTGMASFVTATLGAPAVAPGLIEGISEGMAGAGRFVGGALADDPGRRRARDARVGLECIGVTLRGSVCR
ncbi:MAG: hypothetical protein ACT4NY_31950 [Pseudonocardiales bacterium]